VPINFKSIYSLNIRIELHNTQFINKIHMTISFEYDQVPRYLYPPGPGGARKDCAAPESDVVRSEE